MIKSFDVKISMEVRILMKKLNLLLKFQLFKQLFLYIIDSQLFIKLIII